MRFLLPISNFAHRVLYKCKQYLKNSVVIPDFLRDTFLTFDSSIVISDPSLLKHDRSGEISNHKSDCLNKEKRKVTLISAVKNEAGNVEDWFDRIMNQTRLPDEIIIVDGGSTDGTLDKLIHYSQSSFIPVRIINCPESNIAKNRNRAISEAKYPIIAAIDFGCFPKLDWLEQIILPFEIDNEIVVSAGVYQPIWKHKCFMQHHPNVWLWSNVDDINPHDYLPPGGSIAFKKEAWNTVGGYPEWLTMSGEDTYFDLKLKFLGGKWFFSPGAVVDWLAPESLYRYLKKLYYWAIGDGESGLRANYFRRYFLQLLAGAFLGLAIIISCLLLNSSLIFLWVIIFCVILIGFSVLVSVKKQDFPLFGLRTLGKISQVLGFLKGALNRKEVEQKKNGSVRGTIIVLAGIPFDDTGGGSRSAQITKEFLRQNFSVVYIYKFPKNENRDLNLRFFHPNFYSYRLTDFYWEQFVNDHQGLIRDKSVAGIVEFPLSDFDPIIKKIKQANGKILYDLMDDWKTSLGGDWYSVQYENQFIEKSDLLVATAQPLCERLSSISGREVHLIPNAVDDRIFSFDRNFRRPLELPESKRIILYIGALWGEWFDWELLEKLAKHNADALLCIIGDYRGQFRNDLTNIKFLGLKPQTTLPAYIAFSDSAIIPWKISPITESTSPLKIFEYLAMQCPVIAPDLGSLRNMPGVYLAKNTQEFIELTRKINRSDINVSEVSSFIKQNNWQRRINKLLELLQMGY